MSQSMLAEKFTLSQQTISAYERGERDPDTYETKKEKPRKPHDYGVSSWSG